MSVLEKISSSLKYLFGKQKKMIFLALIAAVVFAVLNFPYDDLSDLITEMISKKSQNQVFVQFDQLGVGFLPPSIKMENVAVDAQILPNTLKAGTLRLAPSLAGFLAFNPGFTASIEDVMKGNISLTYRAGKKINDSTQLQKIDLGLRKIDLKSLSGFIGLPVDLEGAVYVQFDAQVDPNFVEQPDGEIEIKIEKFRLPASTIPTMMGPTSLPNMELSSLTLKGQLKGSELLIEDGAIGGKGEALNGRFKGKMGLRFVRQGQQIAPQWSNYEVKIDLSLDRTSEKNFGLFLSFFDKYKTLTGTGSRYALKLSSPNFQTPPTSSPVGTF